MNGFTNNFWGWGEEDDETYSRLKLHGWLNNRTMHIHRPPHKTGMAHHLEDQDHGERNKTNLGSNSIRRGKHTFAMYRDPKFLLLDGLSQLDFTNYLVEHSWA